MNIPLIRCRHHRSHRSWWKNESWLESPTENVLQPDRVIFRIPNQFTTTYEIEHFHLTATDRKEVDEGGKNLLNDDNQIDFSELCKFPSFGILDDVEDDKKSNKRRKLIQIRNDRWRIKCGNIKLADRKI